MPSHFASPSAAKTAGLLEQTVLRLLRPDAAGRRRLADADGTPVGVVDLAPGWWGFVLTLWVREAFEEPVVFRVRRAWSLRRRWRVEDADGEAVGTVAGPRLLSRGGRVLFRRIQGGRAFELLGGDAAAEWVPEDGGGQLTLLPVVRDEPFWKMLLLAAVLVD
jgi:hypothetical protein